MPQHDEAAKLAENILNLRRRRSDHLPVMLFGEAAWELLLLLFIADARGEHLTATKVCHLVGGSETVAQRWLTVLQEQKLTLCHPQCDDGHLVSLSPAGIHAVEAWMEDAGEVMHM